MWPKVIHCDIISNHFISKRCTQLSWVVLYSLRLCLVGYHNKPYNYIRIYFFTTKSNATPSRHGSLKNLCKEKKLYHDLCQKSNFLKAPQLHHQQQKYLVWTWIYYVGVSFVFKYLISPTIDT
jgi:hypothetical protein